MVAAVATIVTGVASGKEGVVAMGAGVEEEEEAMGAEDLEEGVMGDGTGPEVGADMVPWTGVLLGVDLGQVVVVEPDPVDRVTLARCNSTRLC